MIRGGRTPQEWRPWAATDSGSTSPDATAWNRVITALHSTSAMRCGTGICDARSSRPDHARESVGGAAQQCVRERSQDRGCQQGLERFERVPLYKLIDDIQCEGKDKDLGDSFPSALEQVATLRGIGEKAPQVGVASFPRVLSPVPDGEQDAPSAAVRTAESATARQSAR